MITTEFVVWCDRCGHWERNVVQPREASAVIVWRQRGWIIRTKGKDLCADCAAKRTAATRSKSK